jgi:hypothetical protein
MAIGEASILFGLNINLKMYVDNHINITPPRTPGAEVPKDSSRKPPKEGAITLVALSKEADNPKIPPNSTGGTAFVKAVLIMVFKMPAAIAIGNSVTSKKIILGAKAQAKKLAPIMAVENRMIL